MQAYLKLDLALATPACARRKLQTQAMMQTIWETVPLYLLMCYWIHLHRQW
jgi:hypothetical protein